NHHLCAGHGLCEPLAGDAVDAAFGRAGDDLMAALAQHGDGLRADEAGATDNDDLHSLPSLVDEDRNFKRYCATSPVGMHPLGWWRGRQGRIRWGDAKRACGCIMVLCRPPYAGAPSPRGFLALHSVQAPARAWISYAELLPERGIVCVLGLEIHINRGPMG